MSFKAFVWGSQKTSVVSIFFHSSFDFVCCIRNVTSPTENTKQISSGVCVFLFHASLLLQVFFLQKRVRTEKTNVFSQRAVF